MKVFSFDIHYSVFDIGYSISPIHELKKQNRSYGP